MVALSDRQLTKEPKQESERKPRERKQEPKEQQPSYGEMVAKTRELILSDRQLTDGQRDQALRFLSYAPGKGRGERASDPINRSSGVQIALNYMEMIMRYKENLDNLADRRISDTRPLGGKSGVIRFRKKGSGKGRVGRKSQYTNMDYQPHPNTVIADSGIVHIADCNYKVTLRSQILELLLHEMEERGNHSGLTLNQLIKLFPDRSPNAIKSCVNKAVNQGHLKFNLKSGGLYHL